MNKYNFFHITYLNVYQIGLWVSCAYSAAQQKTSTETSERLYTWLCVCMQPPCYYSSFASYWRTASSWQLLGCAKMRTVCACEAIAAYRYCVNVRSAAESFAKRSWITVQLCSREERKPVGGGERVRASTGGAAVTYKHSQTHTHIHSQTHIHTHTHRLLLLRLPESQCGEMTESDLEGNTAV